MEPAHSPRCDWIRCHVDCPHWKPPSLACLPCGQLENVIDDIHRSMKFTTEGSVVLRRARTRRTLIAHRKQAHEEAGDVQTEERS